MAFLHQVVCKLDQQLHLVFSLLLKQQSLQLTWMSRWSESSPYNKLGFWVWKFKLNVEDSLGRGESRSSGLDLLILNSVLQQFGILFWNLSRFQRSCMTVFYLCRQSKVMVVTEELLRFLAAVARGRVRRQVNFTCLLDPVQGLYTHTHTGGGLVSVVQGPYFTCSVDMNLPISIEAAVTFHLLIPQKNEAR